MHGVISLSDATSYDKMFKANIINQSIESVYEKRKEDVDAVCDAHKKCVIMTRK